MAVHDRHGSQAKWALEMEELLPTAGREREIACGLELGTDRSPALLREKSFHARTDDVPDLLRRHAAVAPAAAEPVPVP